MSADMGSPPQDVGFTDDLYVSPPSDYEGEGLSSMDPSGLFLTADQLMADTLALSAPTRRLLPQRFTQDQATLQPWLMYIPPGALEWQWLLVAVFTPPDFDATRLEGEQRVELRRAGAWYQKSGSTLTSIPLAQVNEALMGGAQSDICGSVRVLTRFGVYLLDGAALGEGIGVVSVVSRQDTLNLTWLSQCSYGALRQLLPSE